MATDRPDPAPLSDGRRDALRRRRVVAALRPGVGRRVAAAHLPCHRARRRHARRDRTRRAGRRVAARRSAARRWRDPPAFAASRRQGSGPLARPSLARLVTVVTPQLGGIAAADGRVVVDDGSVPPLAGAALRLPVNRGPAAARNAGRSARQTPAGRVRRRRRRRCPTVGSNRCSTTSTTRGSASSHRGCWASEGRRSTSGVRPARIRAGTRVSYVPGAAIVRARRGLRLDRRVRRAAALRRGRRSRLAARRAGWRCRYEPAATVWHRPRPAHRRADASARRIRHVGRSARAASSRCARPAADRTDGPPRPGHWCSPGTPSPPSLLAVGSAAALAPKLPDVPPTAAFRLAMHGHLGAAQQLASRRAPRLVAASSRSARSGRSGSAGSPSPACWPTSVPPRPTRPTDGASGRA